MASSRVNKLIIFSIIALLLISCQGSSFTVSDASLEHRTMLTVNEDESISDNSCIVLSFDSSKEDNYTYILKSPEGDVSWEGVFTLADGLYVSEELYLSSHATFEKGEYEYFIYSENGQEKSGNLSLDYSSLEGPFFKEDGEITGLTLQSKTENKIEGRDSYGNSVVIEKEITTSSSQPSS